MYTGKEDPLSHLKYFEMQMDLQGVRGDLAPRKFNSWKAFSSEFHAQFSSSRQFLSHLEDLVEVKQRPGEPLRAYISRFMTEATKVSRVIEDGKLSSILGGIEVLGELWKYIRKNGPVVSISDFLDRAEGFIKLEEDLQRAEGEQKPGKSKAPSTRTSIQLPHYPSNSSSNGKRSSNNNMQGNVKKGKFTSKTEQAPRENHAKYTAFTVLTGHMESVYMATQSLAPFKKSAPMEKDVSKRDITKFCRFHEDYGHDTNECNNLKREIEFLIKKNNQHVQRYVKADQNQWGDNNQDLLLPPIDGHLQVIIGGHHVAGDSGKAQERYARTVQHEQEEVVWPLKRGS
ncbi:uncharacterized protein LOC115720261 [Cannabis sativa]|uniref:uncharacterized protein LOC115720261 n=1 Tax=Cannabis sativa TaxID=3483 RepID=UPI0029CA5F74|nr:uncharacterized protein LOC115720261 [Cannabis sativa]